MTEPTGTDRTDGYQLRIVIFRCIRIEERDLALELYDLSVDFLLLRFELGEFCLFIIELACIVLF